MRTREEFQAKYGPTAVVTGASSGIGREFARALAARGVDLVVSARREERLTELKLELETAHDITVEVVQADLGTKEGTDALVDATASVEVGLLISNAGFGLKGEFVDLPIEKHVQMVRLNCESTMVLLHAFGRRFVSAQRGGIIVTSSTAAFQGTPLTSAYAASKGFGLLLAEGLTEELRGHGVDVLAVCPGPTDTEGPRNTGVNPDDLPIKMMDPRVVAEKSLDSLGRRTLLVPGAINRTGSFLTRLFPRRIAARLAGQAIRRATKS